MLSKAGIPHNLAFRSDAAGGQGDRANSRGLSLKPAGGDHGHIAQGSAHSAIKAMPHSEELSESRKIIAIHGSLGLRLRWRAFDPVGRLPSEKVILAQAAARAVVLRHARAASRRKPPTRQTSVVSSLLTSPGFRRRRQSAGIGASAASPSPAHGFLCSCPSPAFRACGALLAPAAGISHAASNIKFRVYQVYTSTQRCQ